MTTPRSPRGSPLAHLSRRSRSLLAAGLVLGVGGTATAASWTDTSAATADFTAGAFAVQLDDGTGWTDTGEYTVTAPPMYPGAEVYFGIRARTSPDTTTGGTLALTAEGLSPRPADALVGALRYQVIALTNTEFDPIEDCSPDAFTASAPYILGSHDSGVDLAPRTAVDSQSVAAEATDQVLYCVRFSLPVNAPSDVQGTSVEHTWTWQAESAEGQP